MICYAIKNNEGEYLAIGQDYKHYWTTIDFAYYFRELPGCNAKDMAEEYKKCNCKECMTNYEKNLNQIIDKYLYENNSLKQQLKSQPSEIVEKIKEFCLTDHKFKECEIYLREDNGQIIYGFLDNLLKEYQK